VRGAGWEMVRHGPIGMPGPMAWRALVGACMWFAGAVACVHARSRSPRPSPKAAPTAVIISAITPAIMVASLALASTAPARAMTIERVGGDLYASGPIVSADVDAFRAEFARGGLRRLILVDSLGGELKAALQIALLVRDARIDTLVSGQCHSSCSLIFVAGRERRFATGSKPRSTMVGIHGPNNRNTREPSPQAASLMLRFYRERLGSKFDDRIIGQALYAITEHNGMLRLREIERNRPEDRVPWFCPSAQTPPAACTRHHGHDAHTLGVVTHPETVEIDLPASMRTALSYFGLRLDEVGEPLPERLADLSGPACRASAACARGFDAAAARWLEAEYHRAVAIGLDQPGYVFSRNADSPTQAMLRALFACNHMRNSARLCQVVAVDDRQVPDLVGQAERRAAELLRGLPTPDLRAVASENEEVGVETPWTYRTTDVRSPAPARLEGVRRLDTATLAQALRQARPPLLIDVGAGAQAMLPGALHFVNGGRAFRDLPTENAFEKRFLDMLKAAGADPGREVVFYCSDSRSWQSANAAMRAQRAGYTRVSWYRGGLAAWQQAGMPAVQKTAVAVLQ
jgi:PQQ-dependent catabolism-associated CXXCW motif protein